MKAKPLYLINTETNIVYAYSEPLEKSTAPKFIPLYGPLPPIGLDGVRRAMNHEVSAAPEPELTPEQRVERIAAVIHMVPKEEISESGQESMPVVGRLAQLENVTRKEIKAAKVMRTDVLKALRAEPRAAEPTPVPVDTKE